MGSLPNLHELGGNNSTARIERPRQLLARVPTAPAQHQRVFKSKSNGHTSNHITDDLILDVSAYSPVSGRCGRSVRRRDSLSSSIGATSVRRLIGAVGRGRVIGRGDERRRAVRALLALCGAHAIGGAALLPFLALQAGGNAWVAGWGPTLSAVTFLTAAVAALLGPAVLQRCGPSPPLLIFYATLTVFFAAHLLPMPAASLLLPLYLALGLTIGPSAVARASAVLSAANRLAYYNPVEDEDARAARRTTLLRRASRALHFAHDLGLILGSALAATIISFTLNPFTPPSTFSSTNMTMVMLNVSTNCTSAWGNISWCEETAVGAATASESWEMILWTEANVFAVDDSGEKVCGARACPRSAAVNSSPLFANVLAGVFAGLALLGLLAAAAHAALRPRDLIERPGPPALRAVLDTFKDFRLQLAAPLALFIGMEQAFMFTDFTKSFVVCTLGVERVPLVFVGQGLLQSVAAATLSMLLRSIQRRRCLVVAVGLAFHACLLLVQLVWKPSADDPALLYVVSAAWGVCHAIWEQLSWSLLTGSYADNSPAAAAAWANSFAWRHLGAALAFAAHGLLCVRAQLHALAAALLLAAIPAAALEHRLHNLRKLRSISRL